MPGFNFPGRKRRALLERDGLNCQECGVEMKMDTETGQINIRSSKGATIDHIRPKSRGGTSRMDNLQLLCKQCNGQKGSRWNN